MVHGVVVMVVVVMFEIIRPARILEIITTTTTTTTIVHDLQVVTLVETQRFHTDPTDEVGAGVVDAGSVHLSVHAWIHV